MPRIHSPPLFPLLSSPPHIMYKRGGRNLRRSAPQNGAWHRDYGPPPMGARRTPFLLTSRSSNIRIPPAKRARDWPHSLRPTSGGEKPRGSREGEKKNKAPCPHPISADPAACRRTNAPAASVLARRANQQPQGDRKGGWDGRPLVRERQQ